VARIAALAIARSGEITADRVRFPHHEIAVDDRRHEAVRVELQIFGIAVAAERAAVIDPVKRDVELGAAPQHLLHVRRACASPNLQHRQHPPSDALWSPRFLESATTLGPITVYSRSRFLVCRHRIRMKRLAISLLVL